MVNNFILAANLGCDIDLHKGSDLHIVHCRIEAWPDLQALNGYSGLWIVTISAHLFELHEPHYLFEKDTIERESFPVRILDHL